MSEKISFDSLNWYKEEDYIPTTVKINGVDITVKQYLPINEKLKLISKVVSALSGNPYYFVNPIQLDVYGTIEIVKAYSNIEIDDDADPAELYDKLELNDISNRIITAIPATEYEFIKDGIESTVSAFYDYQTSVLGILENVSNDYSNLNLEATEIKDKIANPENLTLLKDVMTKLG